MLSMLVLLALAPQAETVQAEAPPQGLRPATVQEIIDATMPQGLLREDTSAFMLTLSDSGLGCESLTMRVNEVQLGGGLVWREGGQAVGLYRLLDRRVNGCPDPIVVDYRVPGSNAVGREVGRSDGAEPVVVRRP